MEESLKILSKENENLKIKLKLTERNTPVCQENRPILNKQKDLPTKEKAIKCSEKNLNSLIFYNQEEKQVIKKKRVCLQ